MTTNDYQSFSLYKRRERAALVREHYLLVMGLLSDWPALLKDIDDDLEASSLRHALDCVHLTKLPAKRFELGTSTFVLSD